MNRKSICWTRTAFLAAVLFLGFGVSGARANHKPHRNFRPASIRTVPDGGMTVQWAGLSLAAADMIRRRFLKK
jgi:hypothetical protein